MRFALAGDGLDRCAEDLLGGREERRGVLRFAKGLGADDGGRDDAVLVHDAAVLATDLEALGDRISGEVSAGVQTFAEPAEPAQIDDAATLLVDNHGRQLCGAEMEGRALQRGASWHVP